MPTWFPQYKIRRSSRILSYAVRQNLSLLEVSGEAVYLLKRMARAQTTYQWQSRKVSTLTATASANSYSIDSDTGYLRYELWNEAVNAPKEYPDVGTMTVTVQASGGATVWESAVDKYSFIANRTEYAVDTFQDQLDSTGTAIPDSVYIVFNTPPFAISNVVMFTFGFINPLVNPDAMQPVRDNQTDFQNSLYGFEQWLNPLARIRKRHTPNAFLLAFPAVLSDFTITEGGLLQESKTSYWTVPPPSSPLVVEHDVIIRESTGERYQVTNYTPIMIENILVSQHMELGLLDPRSTLMNIPYDKGV